MSTATVTVSGMTCSHCVASVSEEISAIPGVTDVAVQLDSGAVTITSEAPVEPDAIRTAVEEAGYHLASR